MGITMTNRRDGVTTGGASYGGIAAGVSAGVAAWHIGLAATWLPAVRALTPGLAGRGRADHVAITFDDGPSTASTPRFLDLLADRNVIATFFLVGTQLRRDPAIAADIAAAGHELAVHGYHHRNLLGRTPWAVRDDLTRARDLVADAAGREPRYFRPPYGVLSADGALAARRLGMRPVIWTSWARDWTATATADSVLATLQRRRGVRGGATLLLHDADEFAAPGAWRATLAALPELLDIVADRGLVAGPLTDHFSGRG